MEEEAQSLPPLPAGDIKLDNLLLDKDPSLPSFGVDSVKISDLGYSLDLGAAGRERVNAEAADELPGTPPHLSPELLAARVDRKDYIQTLLTQACDAAPEDQRLRLRQLKAAHKCTDKSKKKGDKDTLDQLQAIVGREQYDRLRMIGEVVAAKATYNASLGVVQADATKLDIFSGTIATWMMFHPEFPEPDDGVRHDATDAMRYTRLRRGGRPPTHGSASLSKPLFAKLVVANFFKDGWATDPAVRPTAADMLGRFREAQQA